MNKLIMDVVLEAWKEKEIELDASSLEDFEMYDEEKLNEELKNLIKEQYPELWPIKKFYL